MTKKKTIIILVVVLVLLCLFLYVLFEFYPYLKIGVKPLGWLITEFDAEIDPNDVEYIEYIYMDIDKNIERVVINRKQEISRKQ